MPVYYQKVCVWFDKVEFKMLKVEGKEFQKINQRKDFPPMGCKPFDAGKALEVDLG